ncbi:Uncharacterised protein [Bordetella pertussis]|nr:Uncharacterised protein [Bordetella pertussis]
MGASLAFSCARRPRSRSFSCASESGKARRRSSISSARLRHNCRTARSPGSWAR